MSIRALYKEVVVSQPNTSLTENVAKGVPGLIRCQGSHDVGCNKAVKASRDTKSSEMAENDSGVAIEVEKF